MKNKMIGLILGAMAVFSASNVAKAADNDLILQTRTDSNTFKWVVDKTQIFLGNAGVANFLTGVTTFDDPNNDFQLSDIASPADAAKIQTIMAQTFNVDASKAIFRLRIDKIAYNIHQLQATPNSIQVNDPLLSLDANVSLRGVDIGMTSGIQFDLMLPNPTTQVMESYLTASLDPVSVSIPDSLPPATFGVQLQALRDQSIAFSLKSSQLDSLPVYVRDHQKDFALKTISTNGPITADQIHINPVIVRLGSLSKTITFDEFKPLVQSQLTAILGTILTQVGDNLKTTIGPSVLTAVLSNNMISQFQIADPAIYAKYQLAQFAEPAKDQLALNFSPVVCTQSQYAQFKDNCMNNVGYIPARVISVADHASAKAELTAKLETGTAGVALSISEEYMNRLLKSTIDAKVWDEALNSEHLSFGPKGAFLLLNQATHTPDLVLDLMYSGNSSIIQKLLIHSPLHFPLRLSTTIAFENRDGIPHLVLGIDKVLSNTDEIINGIPSLGLSSKLIKGLRGEIAKMIIDMASTVDGKKPIDTDLPILKNLNVESSTIEGSQYGRLNIFIQQ